MPVAMTRCQVAAPSAVFPIDAVCVSHAPTAEPVFSRRPFMASANEASVLTRPGGVDRSIHVSPRSEERKRRVAATSAHTAGADGALSLANEGSAIGDGEGGGELVGVWLGGAGGDGGGGGV